MAFKHNLRPDSKWTIVCTENGMDYYVRLTPDFVDLESLGRPWGLAFGNLYKDVAEAHKFADSIDLFMDAVLAAQVERTDKLPESEVDWAPIPTHNG